MRIVPAALAASLAVTASGASAQGRAADPAGARMLSMAVAAAVSSDDLNTRSAVYCVSGRDVCLRAWRAREEDGWTLDVHRRLPAGADVAPVARIAVPPSDEPTRETMTIWPHVIVEASGARLFGVLRSRTTGFSGGGASETHLILFRQPPGGEAAEVLTVQTQYGAMIRACFSEEEYRSRGACHDEYEYAGVVTLAPGTVPGPPRLAYSTAAQSYPRGARAEGDETRRLRRSDLVWERDPECSYRRTFAFAEAGGRYEPDRPLPECATYRLP